MRNSEMRKCCSIFGLLLLSPFAIHTELIYIHSYSIQTFILGPKRIDIHCFNKSVFLRFLLRCKQQINNRRYFHRKCIYLFLLRRPRKFGIFHSIFIIATLKDISIVRLRLFDLNCLRKFPLWINQGIVAFIQYRSLLELNRSQLSVPMDFMYNLYLLCVVHIDVYINMRPNPREYIQ